VDFGLRICCIALLYHFLLNRSAGFRLVEPTAWREADLKSEFYNPKSQIYTLCPFCPQPIPRNPQPATRNPQLVTRNPQLPTRNPQPATRNPQLATRNPSPATRITSPVGEKLF